MGFFAQPFLWKGHTRYFLFWLLIAFCLLVMPPWFPFSDWGAVGDLIIRVRAGAVTNLADEIKRPEFAFGVASGIVQVAAAFAVAFLICHVFLPRLALRDARLELNRLPDGRAFAENFQTISDHLDRNGVIGSAWGEFRETTVVHEHVIENTIRPQSFISFADIRDRLFGLKMMGAIPGSFVGLGLLLTFIGLVIALHQATGMVDAGKADQMSPALHGLLEAATFKFSTSIAGLGASIALALLFRSYQIWLEIGFYKFNQALERLMSFHPSQRLAIETRNILAEQRDQLKEINSDRFFSRLGESIGSGMGAAVGSAMQPMTDRLDVAMTRFESRSQDGVATLLRDFQSSLQGGAGVELTALAQTLDATRSALDGVRDRLTGSGADLEKQMAAVSERFVQAIETASTSLRGSASGAAGSMETAMGSVAARIETQMDAVGGALAAIQASFTQQAADAAQRSREAGDAAATASRRVAEESAAAVASAATETIEAVRAGVGGAIASLQAEIAGLVATLSAVRESFTAQTRQIDSVASRSRETADAFGKVAVDVRLASQPLVTHADRVSGATERMATAIGTSVSALAVTQQTANGIANQLSAHLAQMASIWTNYEQRFAKVDEDLGRAATTLSAELAKQQGAIGDFVVKVDAHSRTILGTLQQAIAGLDESVGELSDTLGRHQARTN